MFSDRQADVAATQIVGISAQSHALLWILFELISVQAKFFVSRIVDQSQSRREEDVVFFCDDVNRFFCSARRSGLLDRRGRRHGSGRRGRFLKRRRRGRRAAAISRRSGKRQQETKNTTHGGNSGMVGRLGSAISHLYFVIAPCRLAPCASFAPIILRTNLVQGRPVSLFLCGDDEHPGNQSVHGPGCEPKHFFLQVLGEVCLGLLVRLDGNDDSGLVIDHFDDRGQLGAVDSRLGMPEL